MIAAAQRDHQTYPALRNGAEPATDPWNADALVESPYATQANVSHLAGYQNGRFVS